MGPGADAVGVANVQLGRVHDDRLRPRRSVRELGVQHLDRRLGRIRTDLRSPDDPPRQLVAWSGAGDLHELGVRVGGDRLRLRPPPRLEPRRIQHDRAPLREQPGRALE
jgi:hypothetical protein